MLKDLRTKVRFVWDTFPYLAYLPAAELILDLNARLGHERLLVAALREMKNAMRDSIVEHMATEQELRREISSLKRHLSMAIVERDQARKRKRRRTS